MAVPFLLKELGLLGLAGFIFGTFGPEGGPEAEVGPGVPWLEDEDGATDTAFLFLPSLLICSEMLMDDILSVVAVGVASRELVDGSAGVAFFTGCDFS